MLAQAPEKQQRDFIISSSAWLLFLGGIFELPVTNDSHESIFLHFYHLAFAVLMIVSGLGLLRRKYWGYQAIQMATFVFSIDRIFFLFTANTQAELTDAGIPSVIGDMAVDLFDPRALEMIGHAFTLLGLLSWWGFSLYLYYRRHHFE